MIGGGKGGSEGIGDAFSCAGDHEAGFFFFLVFLFSIH